MFRTLKTHHLAVVMLILISGCYKFDFEVIPEPPVYDCGLHVSDSNLVVGISEVQDSLIFTLENNHKIVRLMSCFSSYYVDTVNWAVNLVLQDSTEQSLPFLGNSFEIDADSILLNPYEWAPLSALVKFSLPIPGRVKLTVHGITENSPDITHVFDNYDYHHAIPVLGLYADHENTVSISVLDHLGNERISKNIRIQTGPLGTIESGQMMVNINEYEGKQKSRMFFVQNAIYDAEGYIRWYYLYRGKKYFPMANGLIAIQLFEDKGVPTTLIEDIRIINFLGEEVDLFDVPNRNHHEINEKSPGGNLLVASNAEPYLDTGDDTEDMIVEIDRQTGEVVKTWDLREIFDPARPRLWTEMPNDWCHLNSIEYDSTDNTLLISSKLQYFISKIDYETGEIKWIFGNHENWQEPWQKYLLTPVNFDNSVHADRDWVYAQHMPRMTPSGHVIVYDNGRNRPGDDFTRALEFSVDESNMTVEKIWTRDFTFSTRTMGSVHVFDDGNVHIGHGEKGNIVEVTRAGDVIFDASLKYFYRSYPIQFY